MRSGKCPRGVPRAARRGDRPAIGSADARPAERQRRRRPAIAPRQLRLVGDAAMLDAIREARIGLRSAEMEIGLAGMADRPFADLLVEVEKAGLVGDLGARLGRDEPARRRRRSEERRVGKECRYWWSHSPLITK